MRHSNPPSPAADEPKRISKYDAFDGSWSIEDTDEVPSATLLRDMRHRIELIALIMMALAGLLATWSTYEAHRWYGLSTQRFSEANLQLSSAVQFHIQSDREILVDLMDFQDWLNAYQRGDQEIVVAIESRFSDQFRNLFAIWRKLPSSAPAGSIRNHGLNTQLADEFAVSLPDSPSTLLVEQSKKTFTQAGEASSYAHSFLIAGSLFGLALIFGVISLRMNSAGMQIAILLFSELFTMAGVAMIIGLPAHFGA